MEPRYSKTEELRIASIMDEFSFNSYSLECQVYQLTPENWEREITRFKPHFLFVESAWLGKDRKWERKIAYISDELKALITWCNKKSIPTLFWNKEDPVHFKTFLKAAGLFDYVFTTDIDCIKPYKIELKSNHVYLLPFSAQPKLHNPLEKYNRKDAFVFAGAYYTRYPERAKHIETFVNVLRKIKPLEIYDRNFQGKGHKKDPRYEFPEQFKRFIIGWLAPDKIQQAYKGYRYAINMNSVTQSQSMFARRAFELLASNTVTVSNYSRGMSLFLGDLVINTDDGDLLAKKIRKVCQDQLYYRKLRLAGLRKILDEHTYKERLAFIAEKLFGIHPIDDGLSPITVIAMVSNEEELHMILQAYRRQRYLNKKLILVINKRFSPKITLHHSDIHVLNWNKAQRILLTSFIKEGFAAGFVADDYYGVHYLWDLIFATKYSTVPVIGKGAWYCHERDGNHYKQGDGNQYRIVKSLPQRSSISSISQFKTDLFSDWVMMLPNHHVSSEQCLAIDEFNYCKNHHTLACSQVDDLVISNVGLPLREIQRLCAQSPTTQSANLGGQLVSEASLQNIGIVHRILQTVFPLVRTGKNSMVKKRINKFKSSIIEPIEKNGYRLNHNVVVKKSDTSLTNGHIHSDIFLAMSDTLVLSNHYPQHDNLYRYMFLHRRIIGYQQLGKQVDIFRFNANFPKGYSKFDNVDVVTGYKDELHQVLSTGRYRHVLVHFLNNDMWDVLQTYLNQVKVIVWIHGIEAQPWHRRAFNYDTDSETKSAMKASRRKMVFWRKIFKNSHPNWHFVFVSRTLSEEVMKDVGVTLSVTQYSIIHNFIDTKFFTYLPKQSEHRKKILSIRPYPPGRTYANDLTIKAILELAKEPFFSELEFRLVGDGLQFEQLTAPLKQFPNVILEQRFLMQEEIVALHQEYGVFLCPTRCDSQGVSRGEAMSSGLVSITNRITAISEFMDEKSGILVETEAYLGLAQAIVKLYHNIDLFKQLSRNATRRVSHQCSRLQTIEKELALFNHA